MAFSNMIRRSVISAVKFAGKRSAVKFSGEVSRRSMYIPATVRFSTAAAKFQGTGNSLVRILETEINEAEEEVAADVPAGFPFKIEDNAGEQIVKLTRRYRDETIEVEVYMPDLEGGEYHEEDDDDDKEADDSEDSHSSTLPLLVKITKNVGPTLEFSCSASPDEISIDSLSYKDPKISEGEDVAYDGPDFGDLDEDLQKAFHKYLNARGITPDVAQFLHEYMITKDSREYKNWLKNLKSFVEA